MIVPEHATEAFATLNGPNGVLVRGLWHDQLVVQRLVVSLPVVMIHVLGDDPPQVPLAERNDPAQALVAYGTYKSLGTPTMLPVSLRSTEHGARVQIGTSGARPPHRISRRNGPLVLGVIEASE